MLPFNRTLKRAHGYDRRGEPKSNFAFNAFLKALESEEIDITYACDTVFVVSHVGKERVFLRKQNLFGILLD